MKVFWYPCPRCGNPKMLKVRSDTRLINFPGYCKRCKQESIITKYEDEPEPERARAN